MISRLTTYIQTTLEAASCNPGLGKVSIWQQYMPKKVEAIPYVSTKSSCSHEQMRSTAIIMKPVWTYFTSFMNHFDAASM